VPSRVKSIQLVSNGDGPAFIMEILTLLFTGHLSSTLHSIAPESKMTLKQK